MIKINKLMLGLVVGALCIQSCKKDMQEINTNPNQLSDTRPEFLFTNATQNYTIGRRDQLTSKYSTVMRYMQYIVSDATDKDALEAPYINPSKTQNNPDPGGSLYSDYYTSYGRDFHRIIDKINAIQDSALKGSYRNLSAICTIMDTYSAWRVADIYGAMPYTQAFNVTEAAVPEFDYGWDLYLLFDKQLKQSADVLNANLPGQKDISKQDFFYAGDAQKWLRMANTLRIKIAQRFEKRDAANLAKVVTDIATNYGGKIISNNNESFGYSNLRDWNNNTNDIDAILSNYDAAYPFVEFLKSTNDPRLPLMVRPNDWGTNSPNYNDVKTKGTAAAKATLDSPAINTSRYWGKHVFSASTSAAYGWLGQTKAHQFSLQDGTQRTLNFISNIQTRVFVKNGGFGNSISGTTGMHTDETVVNGSTIKMRTPLITYADACFMMAEIAAKSGSNSLGKSAAQWYNDGVTASFDDYKAKGIAENTPNAANATFGDFLTRFPYNGLPSIYSQAWVNYLTVPEEAWAMWKRTGYPQFEDFRAGQPTKIGDGSGIAYLESLWTGSQNLLIPRRAALPVTSSEMNANVDQAVQDMKAKNPDYGTDRQDTKGRVWWDMK